MSNDDSGIDYTTYRADLTQAFMEELMKIVKIEEKNHGRVHAEMFFYGLMSSMIATIIHASLIPDGVIDNNINGDSAKQDPNVEYAYAKSLIEEAVASGFAGGFINSGVVDPEFFCRIRTANTSRNIVPA